jgi:phage replication-related protein YjqB (UPF0714/DUF867 family)
VTGPTRRTVLAMLAATPTALLVGGAAPARAADRYGSNTELYDDPALAENRDYARRYRRDAGARTAIVAPHGGGIEGGTSELCLAIAGYHPATFEPSSPTYDYWMFEGIRRDNNGDLHVTSTRCDDPVALSMVRSVDLALGIHGCTPAGAGPGYSSEAILVGGRHGTFRQYLIEELAAKGFDAVDASGHSSLGGTSPENICNKTRTGAGAQLEIMAALRAKLFDVNTREGRRTSTNQRFDDFVAAARRAITRAEAA